MHLGAIVSQQREILTWEGFGVASHDLAIKIAESGYEPDMILAIARGGLFLAGALGYSLAVKNTYTMNVEFYTGVNQRLDMPMILPPVPDFEEVRDAKILIVDDVADTGQPLSTKSPILLFTVTMCGSKQTSGSTSLGAIASQ